MANVEKLLHGSEGVDLLTKLDLLAGEERLLKAAKAKIREHLKIAISEATRSRLGRSIVPRFFTQGSSAYKTLNRPPWMPPQRKDFDDGVYLPMTFVKGARPSQAASTFFAIVDAALKVLITREGWKGFEEKPACARVIIDDTAHVDVPLYAIPDDEFNKLTKAAMEAMTAADSADFDFMRSRMDRLDSWDVLPSDKVLLAHREEDWKPSDPRKIHEWFLAAVKDYGERLRRECRYLKAWRDFHKLDYVSSIILMVCAWTVFEELGQLHLPTRDDLMLLKIAERLPDLFSSEIENAADPPEMLGVSWTADQRRAAIKAAAQMREDLDMAINHCWQSEAAVSRMQAIFGSRIPDRPDLVSVKAAAAAAVAAAPVRYTPAPNVGRSTSG
jgi:cyclic GMP-AMP synthase